MAAIVSDLGNRDDANDYLKNMAKDLEKNPPKDKNEGHQKLLDDLSVLLYDAWHYEFNDFKNNKYATPKVVLRKKLLDLAENVEQGKYDN